MSIILTVTLVKGSRKVKVNADDTLRFIKAGYERIKVRKQTTDPDLLAAQALADAAEAEGKTPLTDDQEKAKQEANPPEKKEQGIPNLDDLQVE